MAKTKTIFDEIDENAERARSPKQSQTLPLGASCRTTKWSSGSDPGVRLANCHAPFQSRGNAGRMDFLGTGRP
jgi:hypothetical protein